MKSEYLNKNKLCKIVHLRNVFTWRSDIEIQSEYLNKNKLCQAFHLLYFLYMTIRYWNENWISEQEQTLHHIIPFLSLFMTIRYWKRVNIWKITLQNISSFVMSLNDDHLLKWRVNIWRRTNYSKHYSVCNVFSWR